MPKEATMPMPQPPEEDEEEKDEEGEEEDDESEEATPTSQAEQAAKSGEGREAKAEAKVVPTPEQTQKSLLEKADGLITRLEAVIGKLKDSKLAEGKKILAEAREYKKELKIKLAKIRKGAEFADFSEVIDQAEAVEKRAEKLTAVFEVGEMVAWKNDKGEEMRGEVIGLGEAEGVVIVKTEKNPKGFAVAKSKLEKLSVAPDRAKILISAAKDFDALIAAMEQVGDLRREDGTVYSKKSLIDLIKTVRDNPDMKINSPFIHETPLTGGLREKLIELIKPREYAGWRDIYTQKNAALIKNYSGIVGWMRRAVDRGGYKKASEAREEAYENYAKARAEQVAEDVDKMIAEEIALADGQADAFQKEKGWGSKFYDRYKKLGKVRMIISAGLVGGGFLLSGGAPAFAIAGIMGARRLLGGTGVAVGSYDFMNKRASKNKPHFDLTPEQQIELDKIENEQGLQWYKKEIKFFGKPSEKGQKWQQQRQALDAKRAGYEKIQAETKAPEMSDADLQKAIVYFEAVTVWNGKKPSADPTYMLLMTEKAKRYKKALKAEASPDASPADKRPFEEQVVARRKEKTAEAMVTVIDSLKQRYLVDQKLFEKMRAVKGTPEQRKNSPEYAAWTDGRKKLAEMDSKLPPDIQTFLQKYSEGKKHPSMAMLIPKIAGELRGVTPNEIDEAKLWESDWQLVPELQAELNELLDRNALLQKDAENEVREAMTATVETVEADREKVDKVKTAVLGFLDAEMRKQDAAVEKRRRLAVYADAAMKAAAAAIGVVIGAGVIQEWIRGQFAAGPVETPPQAAPTVEPVRPVLATTDEFNPDDYTGQSVQPDVPRPGLHDVVTPWKPNVLEMQKLLEDAGHSPGGLDGKFGKLTSGAIKAFQLEHDLPVTGKASKSLMAALRAAAAEKAAEAAADVPVEAAPKADLSKFAFRKTEFEFGTDHGPEKAILQEVVETKPSGEEISYDLEGNKIEFQESVTDTETAPVEASPVEAAPVEAAPAEQATETAVAAKEAGKMSVEFSGGHIVDGKVWMDGNSVVWNGTIVGVGHDDLVAARILRPNWFSAMHDVPGGKSLARSMILNDGRQLLLLKEAMGQAGREGNEQLARAISARMHGIANDVERRFGADVFTL